MKEKILRILKNAPINLDFARHFTEVIFSETKISTAGYPFLSEFGYNYLIENVGYLFKGGDEALEVLHKINQDFIRSGFISSSDQLASAQRALAVCRQVIFTANICAPTDLWVLKNLLSNWTDLGINIEQFPPSFTVQELARSFEVNEARLKIDLNFLYSRGLLEKSNDSFIKANIFSSYLENSSIRTIFPSLKGDITAPVKEILMGTVTDQEFVRDFFTIPTLQSYKSGWLASGLDTECAFRVVPLVIAARQVNKIDAIKKGASFFEVFSDSSHRLLALLKCFGYCCSKAKFNELGERVFQRGLGPFGIIYAYLPYFSNPEYQYRGVTGSSWVTRSANIDASQKANARSFKDALTALERFKKDTGFEYATFIEHAVGKGEATRQHWLSALHNERMRYIGADLEMAAIASTQKAKEAGELPPNMVLLALADIGVPATLAQLLNSGDYRKNNIVMIVGNGFHEVREQTDEKMISIFREYQELGILLIFVEESGLSDEDIRHTAWNTYHAGFKYVHEISGQGLRPVFDDLSAGEGNARLSWRSLVEKAGYMVIDQYCVKTRTIYPHPRPNGKNPCISMTYFCLPGTLKPLLKLGENTK